MLLRATATNSICSLTTVVLLLILVLNDAWLVRCSGNDANGRPVIGVLAQEYVGAPWDGVSCIPASYVKFVELGGARVVPIHIDRNATYYRKLLAQLNGVLLPGGDVDPHNSGYGRAGKIIFEYALDRNQRGDFFPLWGTCNGLEMLIYLCVNEYVLTHCDSINQAAPLVFTNASTSRLFANMPSDVEKYLSTKNTTVNFHEWCLTPEAFKEFGINRLYRATSVSKDPKGLEYISSIEAKQYPFYAVQFHPEMNTYEWTRRERNNQIPHFAEAIRVTEYFAEFFVNEARKSKHQMSDELFAAESIYNYQANYTQSKSFYTQIYFFENTTEVDI